MKSDLKKLASKVRQAIQHVISESDYVDGELNNFPSGSCEVASVMTGLYMKKVGINDVTQSVGKRPIPNDINEDNHVWLTINGKYIVDITASQFDDCNITVIVEEETDFHNSFNVYDSRPVDSSYLTRLGSEGYGNVFSEVLARIEST